MKTVEIPQSKLADRIKRAIETTAANTKARTYALKAIRWTLRNGGRYVRLNGDRKRSLGCLLLLVAVSRRETSAVPIVRTHKRLTARL